MYKIYKGGNTPIHIKFAESTSTFTYISAGVYSSNVYQAGEQMKHWDKADMTVSGADAYLPLTQDETSAFKACCGVLLVKYRKSTNPVEIVKEIPIEIVERYDADIKLGAN